MVSHKVKILKSDYVTHDVKRFVIEKPAGYSFVPGQATDVSIDLPGWTEEMRPFTFTSLNSWPDLEFIIKIYHDHQAFTNQLEQLKPGDHLIIREPWGAITYKGPGVFIAGGAGITPFISILRQLESENKIEGNMLIYSNKYFEDIILREELYNILQQNFFNFLTRQSVIGFFEKRISRENLIQIIKDFNQYFYVCGPEQFVADITNMLKALGANPDSVVIEK